MIINMNGAKAPETPSSVLQEKTVTPETLPTVIGPDEGYDGLSQVTVNPDAQLKAENIRSGKTIFGVAGSFEGEAVLKPVNTFEYLYENNLSAYGYVSVTSDASSITYTTPGATEAPKNNYVPFNERQGYGDANSCIVVGNFSMSSWTSANLFPVEDKYADVNFGSFNVTSFDLTPSNRSGTDVPSGTPVTIDMDYVVTLGGCKGNITGTFEMIHYTGTGKLSGTYGYKNYYTSCGVKLDTPLTIPAGNVKCIFSTLQTSVRPTLNVIRAKVTW